MYDLYARVCAHACMWVAVTYMCRCGCAFTTVSMPRLEVWRLVLSFHR